MERYVIRGGREGADRLRVLARSWEPTTLALFERVGLGPGHHCVDLGCGGGDVTVLMAQAVGPGGRVVAVDRDEVSVEVARERCAELGLRNVELVVSSVYDWSDHAAYDLVYCRNVLQHLTRPVEVLRSMWAAARPGGVVAAEDADFGGSFCHPPNDGFTFWVERYQQVLAHNGGDPHSGRKLASRFLEAGTTVPAVGVVQRADLTGEPKTLPYLTIEATADSMVAAGVATVDEVRAALLSVQAAADDPATLFGSPRIFQVWSRKPAR